MAKQGKEAKTWILCFLSSNLPHLHNHLILSHLFTALGLLLTRKTETVQVTPSLSSQVSVRQNLAGLAGLKLGWSCHFVSLFLFSGLKQCPIYTALTANRVERNRIYGGLFIMFPAEIICQIYLSGPFETYRVVEKYFCRIHFC